MTNYRNGAGFFLMIPNAASTHPRESVTATTMIMTMAVTLAMARAMPMTIIQVFAFGAIVLGIFPHRRYESFVTDHGMCGSPVPKKRVFV